MSFSFCLNRNEMLTLCGLSLLYQGLDLKQEGKLMKDGQRLVCAVVKYLDKANAPGALDFRRLAASMITFDSPQNATRRSFDSNMSAPSTNSSTSSYGPPRQPLQQSPLYSPITCSSDTEILQKQTDRFRRATFSEQIYSHSNMNRSSIDSVRSESPKSRRQYGSSISQVPTNTTSNNRMSFSSSPVSRPNLDYLPLDNNSGASQPRYPVPVRTSSHHKKPSIHTPNFPQNSIPMSSSSSQSRVTNAVTPAEWETLLSALDSGESNIYDAVYGGPNSSLSLTTHLPDPAFGMLTSTNGNHNHNHAQNNLSDVSLPEHALTTTISNTSSNSFGDWSPGAWDMAALNMQDFDIVGSQSVLSFSEDSLSSGDDLDAFGLGQGSVNSVNGSGRQSLDELYRNTMPLLNGEGYLLDGMENFGL